MKMLIDREKNGQIDRQTLGLHHVPDRGNDTVKTTAQALTAAEMIGLLCLYSYIQ